MNVNTLVEEFPHPEQFLKLPVEEVAFCILKILDNADYQRNVMLFLGGNFYNRVHSAYEKKGIRAPDEVRIAFDEAWQWLVNEGLIAQSYDGNQGFFVTRKGKNYADRDSIKAYLISAYLSPDMLHPKLQQKVYSDFVQGEFDAAVFKAFKLVEVTARKFAGLSREIHGKGVFQEFLSEKRQVTFPDEYSEKDRANLINLFRAAYELYRNPSGHRDIDMQAEEAVELIMLANHLLRIIDKFNQQKVVQKDAA